MIPTGRWVNRLNGKEIFVRDVVSDGDKMLVLTDQGQLPMQEFANYIQLEEGEIIPTVADLFANNKTGNLQSQLNQGIPKEDIVGIITTNNKKPEKKKQLHSTVEKIEVKKEEPKKNNNYDLIKKVFDKFPVERSIEFSIIEKEWPFNEFKMLVNVLDVPVEDICDYVIDNYLNKENLVKSLSEYFQQFM